MVDSDQALTIWFFGKYAFLLSNVLVDQKIDAASIIYEKCAVRCEMLSERRPRERR